MDGVLWYCVFLTILAPGLPSLPLSLLLVHLNVYIYRSAFGTYPSPFYHVVFDNLLRAFRVRSTVHERLIPIRVVVCQNQLAAVLPVIPVQIVRTAVTARAPDRHVAQGGSVAQAPHAVSIKVGHVPTCNNNDVSHKITNSFNYQKFVTCNR